MKTCTHCLRAQPLDAFTRRRKGAEHLRPTCRTCVNAARKARATPAPALGVTVSRFIPDHCNLCSQWRTVTTRAGTRLQCDAFNMFQTPCPAQARAAAREANGTDVEI